MFRPTRREFLKGAVAVAAGGLAGLPLPGCGTDDRGVFSGAPEAGRLATTMWEFSWLVRRQGREAEYADWDRVLDGLALRGYGNIRLDAFPHLVAAGPDGERVDRFTVLPQTPLFFWGNHEPVAVEPRSALVSFLRKVRARGMTAGLSTWFNDDTLHRADAVVTPADYGRIWRETLDLLADANLLDIVAWVDLCNEFPLGKWARGAYPAMFDAPITDFLPVLLPWNAPRRARVQAYLDEGIGIVREAYPELRYTFSMEGGLAGPNMRTLDTASLDLAEVHVWISNDPAFALASGQLLLLLETEGSLERHVSAAPGLYFSRREHWLEVLSARMDVWKAWAEARGLPLITTESWGPINYDDVAPLADGSEWAWVKDICAAGVRMAVEKGWAGICTSNFCQPHFEGMWADVGWHRALTRLIRAAGR